MDDINLMCVYIDIVVPKLFQTYSQTIPNWLQNYPKPIPTLFKTYFQAIPKQTLLIPNKFHVKKN